MKPAPQLRQSFKAYRDSILGPLPTTTQQLYADFLFAQEWPEEFSHRQAPLLRYVAALNVGATQAEFVQAAQAAGYHPATAAIQFRQSRRASLEMEEGATLAPDGRLRFS